MTNIFYTVSELEVEEEALNACPTIVVLCVENLPDKDPMQEISLKKRPKYMWSLA